MEEKIIKRTPCIGVCSTTYGDDICRGCRRFRHEITSWINYSDLEKNIINRRLEKFKIIVLEEKFLVSDLDKFKNGLIISPLPKDLFSFKPLRPSTPVPLNSLRRIVSKTSSL